MKYLIPFSFQLISAHEQIANKNVRANNSQIVYAAMRRSASAITLIWIELRIGAQYGFDTWDYFEV